MVVPGESAVSARPQEPARNDATRSERLFRWGGALLVIGVVVAAGALAVHIVREARASELKTRFKNSMKQLGVYFALYESRYKAYPADEQSIRLWLQKEAIDPESLLTCPLCRQEITFNLNDPATLLPSCHDGTPPDFPMAWHSCPKTGKTEVLFFQGRVDVFAEAAPATWRK